MKFNNRTQPNIYQLIDIDGDDKGIKNTKRVELRRIAQDGETGTPLSAESFNQFDAEKVSKMGISSNEIDISSSKGCKYYIGCIVKGTISNNTTVVLTNCSGEVTIQDNQAILRVVNCPELSIIGKTKDNWFNIIVDGVADYFIEVNRSRLLSEIQGENYALGKNGIPPIFQEGKDTVKVSYSFWCKGWSTVENTITTMARNNHPNMNLCADLSVGTTVRTANIIAKINYDNNGLCSSEVPYVSAGNLSDWTFTCNNIHFIRTQF